MKTNEADTPWDPKPDDHKVSGKLLKEGVDQLERDVLRFLEMIPDIPAANVRIVTNVAFPMVREKSPRALTKEDFTNKNQSLLLEKLGVSKEYLKQPHALGTTFRGEDQDTYERIICRYLGAHSKVPGKVPMDDRVQALELAVKGTDSGFKAQVANPDLPKTEHMGNIRKAVAQDQHMTRIRKALLAKVQNAKSGKEFQSAHINIPLDDLEVDKDRFMKQKSSKKYPLFGSSVIETVLRAADEEAGHQGLEEIADILDKENFVFFDENGTPIDQNARVAAYVQECSDCSRVREIRMKVPSASGRLVQVPKELEAEVLDYADRRHQGYADAYNRLKNWADFPDFRRKVC